MKELPSGWEWTTLGQVATPGRPKVSPATFPELPFIGMEHVEAQTMRLLGTVPAGELKSAAVHFQAGDVMYGRLRPYLNKVLRPAFEGLCSSEFIVFPPSLAMDQQYLQHILNSAPFVSFASHLNAGDRPRVDFEQIGSFELALPPSAEQRRIVAEIDQQLSRIDTALGQLMAVRQKTVTFAISVIRSATSAKPHWRIARTAEMCSFITKGTTPASHQLLTHGDVPFLKVNNLTFGGPLDFSRSRTFISKQVHDNELSRSKVRPGDVLMNIVGPPLGKVAIVPDTYPEFNINQAIARFRPVPGVHARYLALLLRNPEILAWALKRAKTTAGQVNLTLELCRDLPLPIAPETEQQQIAVAVDQALALSDNARLGIDTALARAARLRQAILKKAFEGKLVPQDPNDEPASALLDRIRASRAQPSAHRAPRKRKVHA